MKKLERFKENETFSCLYQPNISYDDKNDFFLKGKWVSDCFKNSNPLFIEVGCGRGDYTVKLAKTFPNINFIGIDVKGSRLWFGAKQAETEQISNVRYLRTRVEFLDRFFAKDEVNGMWITFPDPHVRISDRHRRLVSPAFLSLYSKILYSDGNITLKTDNSILFDYALKVIKRSGLHCIFESFDVHADSTLIDTELNNLTTNYESRFMSEGKKIMATRFSLKGKSEFTE